MSHLHRIRALMIAIWATAFGLHAQVTAHYINVGQAASALIEFKSGAILIDAGGETTKGDDVYRKHLLNYLNDFFQRRTDLNKTLEGVIISHPHIDHTMYLMDVMQNFTVHALIDNGADKGSGIAQLKQARAFAKLHKIHYTAVGDSSIHKSGLTVALIEPDEPGAPKIALLSGFRDCDNANNDSITVRIQTPETTLLFTGDSQSDDAKCTPALTALGARYASNQLLSAKVYHVAHHGSFNGTTDEFLKLVSPTIAVISAGDPARQGPGAFHAFQFGHPREVAVTTLVSDVSGMRDVAKPVVIFPKAKQSSTITMSKAVYCTCWDGDVKIEYPEGKDTPQVSMSGFHPPIVP